MDEEIVLTWKCYTSMKEAGEAFRRKSCVYVIAAPSRQPLYIGKTEGVEGLWGRYKGGTASSMDAALHGSGNLIFVAAIAGEVLESVENALIYAEQPPYNNRGKIIPLSSLPVESILHAGHSPTFTHRRCEEQV